MKKLLMTACAALATIVPTVAQTNYTTPDTEMRSAWIATVYRLDWPSEVISTTGSTSQINQQKKSLTRMLDSMAVNNMNAAKLQIRSRCDALYKSSYEPWSTEIVSRRGMDPGYDPFEFFVQECHSRGMEAHAWLNPYRYESDKGQWDGTPMAYKTDHPDWLLTTGSSVILNPGLPEVRQRICDIVAEIVTQYDLDGLLFDDYFYVQGTEMSQDEDLYNKYRKSGGTLSQGDWRRENVNMMLDDVYRTIKKIKPWVRFGVSPAGLTCTTPEVADKHGVPVCGSGKEYQYNGIYADPLAWMERKSLDYISPQIYWTVGYSEADYGVVAKWWSDITPQYRRHLFISHSISTLSASSKAPASRASGPNGETFEEYARQVQLARDYSLDGAPGNVYYRAKYLYSVAPKFAHYLRNTVYTQKALLPAMTWLPAKTYGLVDKLAVNGNAVTWAPEDNARYAVYAEKDGAERLLGFTYTPSFTLPAGYEGSTVSVAIMDRFANVFGKRTVGVDPRTLSAPQNLAPANGVIAETPFEFSWDAVDGAESYLLRFATDPNMEEGVASARVYGATSVSATDVDGLPSNADLYWTVTAIADNATPATSAPAGFTVFTRVVLTPGANEYGVSLTPQITWNGSADAVTVQIAGDVKFTKILFSTEAKDNTCTVPKYILRALTDYYVRIAYEKDGVTKYSDPVHFITEGVDTQIPEFAEPLDGGILYSNRAIAFKPIEGVSRLRLEVSASSTFPPRSMYLSEKVSVNDFKDVKTGSAITISGKKLVDGQTYYARARATFNTSDGTEDSEYCEPITFTYSASEAGVEDVTAEGPAVTVDGLAVIVSNPGSDVTMYNAAGVAVTHAAAAATVRMTAPAPGVYIVKCAGGASKVTLR